MEKDLSFLKGDLSSLAHDTLNLKFVKKQLQVGMYKEAERILSLMQLDDPQNSTINFYLAKIYFAMNRYEDSQSCYLLVKPESKKFWKSIANRAFVINMSGNFMQALQLIRQVDKTQLDDIQAIKHQLKLSSVLKRGSCYPEAMTLLQELNDKVEEMLEKEENNLKLLKLMHKILREQSRLCFLQKNSDAEQTFEDSAQIIYTEYLERVGIKPSEKPNHFGFPVMNIKVFKLIFNRAYRMCNKNEEVTDGITIYKQLLVILDQMFADVQPNGSFYHAKVFFELAKAYSTTNNQLLAGQTLTQGQKILEDLFGPQHAVMMDYYQTAIQVNFETQIESDQGFIQLSEDLIKLEQTVNCLPDTGKPYHVLSPFNLESLLLKTQVILHKHSKEGIEVSIEQMKAVISEMELAVIENTSQMNGNPFTWRATTLLCMLLTQAGKLQESFERLEVVLEQQLAYTKEFPIHVSTEYSLSQLAVLSTKLKKIPQAENLYSQLVNVRVNTYGPLYYGILPALLTLTSIQTSLGKDAEAEVNFMKGIGVCEELLKEPRTKNRALPSYYQEFLQQAYHSYSFRKMPEKTLETAQRIVEFTRKEFGESSEQYCDGLYLCSKAVYLCNQPEEALRLCKQAIDISIAKPRSRTVADLQFGMLYLLKATILSKTNDPKKQKEGLKAYSKAVNVFDGIEGGQEKIKALLQKISQEINDAIKNYELSSGEEVDFDELSEEEDYDVMVFKPQVEMHWATSPLMYAMHVAGLQKLQKQ